MELRERDVPCFKNWKMLMLISDYAICQSKNDNYLIIVLNYQHFMFLTKKTTHANKLKPKNSKALGGWDDDQPIQQDNHKQNTIQINANSKLNSNNIDLLGDDNPVKPNTFLPKPQITETKAKIPNSQGKGQAQTLYTSVALSSMANIECERKIVQNILTPGGIRVKQSDVMLNQFYEQVKLMDISIIGSLLIDSLYSQDADFQVKARTLYAIEHLCKKSVQFSVYFKLHAQKVKESPNCHQHEENYQKIKKTLLGTLGALVVKPEERKLIEEELIKKEGINFVDPGYNAPEEDGLKGFINVNKRNYEKVQKEKPTKKLISPMELKKKPLEGPPNAKKFQPENFNLLGDDEKVNEKNQSKTTGNSKQSKDVNLLQLDDGQKESQDLLSFH